MAHSKTAWGAPLTEVGFCVGESETDADAAHSNAYELPVSAGGVSPDGYLVPRTDASPAVPAYYAVADVHRNAPEWRTAATGHECAADTSGRDTRGIGSGKNDDGANHHDVYYSVPVLHGDSAALAKPQPHREYLVPQPVDSGAGFFYANPAYSAAAAPVGAIPQHVDVGASGSAPAASAGAIKINTSRPRWRRRSAIAVLLLLLLGIVGAVVAVGLATSGDPEGSSDNVEQAAATDATTTPKKSLTATASKATITMAPITSTLTSTTPAPTTSTTSGNTTAPTTTAGVISMIGTNTTVTVASTSTTAANTTSTSTTTTTSSTTTSTTTEAPVTNYNSTSESNANECALELVLSVPLAAPQGWKVTVTLNGTHEGVVSTWGDGYVTDALRSASVVFYSLSPTANMMQSDSITVGMHMYKEDEAEGCPEIESITFVTRIADETLCTSDTMLATTGLSNDMNRHAGQAVAVAAPGRFFFVGAPGANTKDGAVLVYERGSNGTFSLLQVTPGLSGNKKKAGRSLSAATNGHLVAGGEGNALVYTVADDGTLTHVLTLDDTALDAPDDTFGGAVATTGHWIVAGQPKHTALNLDEVGAVFVWRRTAEGFRQTPSATLIGDENTQSLGTCVAIEGLWLAAGAPKSKAIMIARYDMDLGMWARIQVLGASSNVAAEGALGSGGLALAAPWLAAGALSTDTSLGGQVVLFRLQDKKWTERTVLSGSQGGAMFGASLALYGRVLAVGAPTETTPDDSHGSEQGRVIVYHLAQFDEQPYAVQQTLSVFGPSQAAKLGSAVAVGGNALLAGAPYADVNDEVSGSGLARLQCM